LSYEDFIARLNPKVAANLKTAQETQLVKLPLASYRLTNDLNGGIAKGRITLIYGSTSAGKSLLAQQSIAKWQKEGLVCAYVDVEGTWEKNWASRLGVNNDELILIQAKSSGRIEKEITPLLEAEVDVLVIDSISDILPEVFVDKSGAMNEQTDRKQVGAQAKAITALLNGIHYVNKNTAVIIISQTTTFFGQSYVEQVPHGGKKTEFASSQIIRLTSSASPNQQKKGEVFVGDRVFELPVAREVEYLVKKNKLGAPFRANKYMLFYDGPKIGIDYLAEIVDEAVDFGVIKKGGAWFTYNGTQWQGRDNVVKHLEENPDALAEIEGEINMRRTGEISGSDDTE
jgi:recombination protein RecA